ncbi:tyrosine-protein kinase Srms [Stegastes partitus]|uniref:Tyrosine-protein kinase n=1 Tax=Stegastes partitus TaxID=144197 RepID=A0A9Y4MXD8_9TELE|nr:PREDICTED: tyrosine-protein kinase SRK3-like [Stegastes partitus]
MEGCCRSCMPCLGRLWNWIWPEFRYPNVPNHNNVIANPATQAAEIRTVSGDIRVPSPKKRPVQLYAALFDFEARSDDELTVKEGDKLSVLEKRGEYVLAKKLTGSLESGLIPANYVALLQDEFAKHNLSSIRSSSFKVLQVSGGKRSSSVFTQLLLLKSRSEGKVYHFRIQRSSIGAYFVSDKVSFGTLGELVSYYQKNPRSLGVPLEEPCAQQRELFDMEPWERPREEFKLTKKLGEGHFGQVWEAVWSAESKKVAIKMLKQEDTKQDEFVKEVQALKSLHHPKLIQLLAMCSRGEPVYIVTELMSKGSLKSYLTSAEGQVLTSAHLIYMGSQVAEGMAYLEDRNIVHRDLAARNILVGDDLVCKVADFGLARIIKDSVYTASRSTKIPVRWTAPEAAIYQRFSVKSDVWSFGVLLYEMMSRGKMPYEGKSNKEVLDLLSSGFRLPCPTRCPQNIYRIMMDCWAAEPSKRPSFHALHSQLDTIYARIYFKTIEV